MKPRTISTEEIEKFRADELSAAQAAVESATDRLKYWKSRTAFQVAERIREIEWIEQQQAAARADEVDGHLTPEQRRDIQLGEWIARQRREHAVGLFLCLVFGAGLGAALSRWFF